MKRFQLASMHIAYAEAGSGPPVILAHCSSASHKMWNALIDELSPTHRVLAPDLIGYGETDRWPSATPYDPNADVQVLAALAERAGQPVHLVGHSYGGAMALEAARLMPGRVSGMTLIEPVSFHFLKAGGAEAELRIVRDFAARTTAAVRAGDMPAAADAYMGFWLGRLRWWFAPRKLKRSVVETVDKVALEIEGLEQRMADDLAVYRAIRVPTLLIVGDKTRSPAKAVARLLCETLPDAHLVTLHGAGHMSPFTHRDRVNRLIAGHIRQGIDAAARGR